MSSSNASSTATAAAESSAVLPATQQQQPSPMTHPPSPPTCLAFFKATIGLVSACLAGLFGTLVLLILLSRKGPIETLPELIIFFANLLLTIFFASAAVGVLQASELALAFYIVFSLLLSLFVSVFSLYGLELIGKSVPIGFLIGFGLAWIAFLGLFAYSLWRWKKRFEEWNSKMKDKDAAVAEAV